MSSAKRIAFSVACLALGLAVLAFPLGAAEVRLAWQPNTEHDLTGYGIYFREAVPGPPYALSGYWGLSELERIDAPQAVVEGLTPGRRYCFAVTAYNASGLESAFSEPVCGETAEQTPREMVPPESEDERGLPVCDRRDGPAPQPDESESEATQGVSPSEEPGPSAHPKRAAEKRVEEDSAGSRWDGGKRLTALWRKIYWIMTELIARLLKVAEEGGWR